MIDLKKYEHIDLQNKTEIKNLINILNDEIVRIDDEFDEANIYGYNRAGIIIRKDIETYTLLIGLLTRLYLTDGRWDLRAAQDITAILGGHI